MRIFNKDKDKEIESPDLSKGKLVLDKIFKEHHDAIPEVIGKSVDEIAQELLGQGIGVDDVEENGVIHRYRVLEVFPNGGKEVEEIEPITAVPAKEAWDEYEDIYVYQEFSSEEQDAYDKNILRGKRYNLLLAFDKWEKAVLRGRKEDSAIVMNWYQQLLDLNAKAFEEESIPSEIQYYLK